jgi:hypothetical protein
MKRSSRTASNLSESLHQRLNAYAIATGAAGMGMLTLAQPIEAKIIYTPANISIVNHSRLDLNHDHKADFSFTTFRTATTSGGHFDLFVEPVGTKNRIWGTGASASALGSGVRISPNKNKFSYGHDLMGTWRWNWNSSASHGPWRKVTTGYLGFRFEIKGKTHYGWARLFVQGFGEQAILTGYAYETIPNQAIITGKTKGEDDSAVEQPNPASPATPTSQPATLTLLAIGVQGLSIWRRELRGSQP